MRFTFQNPFEHQTCKSFNGTLHEFCHAQTRNNTKTLAGHHFPELSPSDWSCPILIKISPFGWTNSKITLHVIPDFSSTFSASKVGMRIGFKDSLCQLACKRGPVTIRSSHCIDSMCSIYTASKIVPPTVNWTTRYFRTVVPLVHFSGQLL